MQIPDDYADALTDELGPYGFAYTGSAPTDDGGVDLLFEAEAESFVRANPELGIEESYGGQWPPEALELWLRFDAHGDPVEISFEVFDLLADAASTDPALHARLSSMEDPGDHAVAVGQAMGRVLAGEVAPADDYLE